MIERPRLRFVTARYEALQGLRTSVRGAVFLAAGLVQLVAGLDSLGARAAVLAGVVVALIVVERVADPAIGRWYERTYGRVERDDATRRTERASGALLIAGIAVMSTLADSLPVWGAYTGMAVVAALVAARNWRHFGGACMTELALAATFAVAAALVAARAWSPGAFIMAAWLPFGIGLLLAGLLDHLLLARALRSPGPEADGNGV